jgi:hypothetical protein
MVLNPDEHIKPGCSAPPYSSDWLWGGPIIEEERIGVGFVRWDDIDEALPLWVAYKCSGSAAFEAEGFSPLIAAMRCYVASKLGDTIEVPEGLQ